MSGHEQHSLVYIGAAAGITEFNLVSEDDGVGESLANSSYTFTADIREFKICKTNDGDVNRKCQ